jgi:hypothetical protein
MKTTIMSDEEYFDNLPDAFGDVDGVDWAAILAGPTAAASGQTSTPVETPHDNDPAPAAANAPGSRSSSYFNDDDDDYLDPGILAEIDEIERQATQSASTSGVSEHVRV